MKNLCAKYAVFSAIVLLAVFLRLYQIGTVPPSASLDEASVGFNAYSIIHTGADEYGTTFPILLRAYDDWRPAMHVYTTIPFVKLFGLTTEAVRLPSVILSILTVIASYFIAKELFPKLKKYLFGEITALLLAISPWHIYISRLGHEANEGLAFSVFGLLFFLKKRMYLASIFFALALMSYHPEKVFIPVVLFGLLIFYKKEIFAMKKKIVVAAFIATVMLTPFLKATFSPNGLIRLEGSNVFTAQSERFQNQAIRLAKAVEEKDIIGQIVFNRRILAAQIFVEGYASHFDPRWLFTNASADRHKVPSIGLLYIWEVPLLILGIFFLIVKVNRKIKGLIFLWILAAPLAAAIATDTPHAMRSYTMLPLPQILVALGLIMLFSYGEKYKFEKVFQLLFASLVVISLVYFYKQYFIVFPKTQSNSFQYALSKTIPFVLDNKNRYDKIIFSNSDNLYQSYMFFLFYSRYDPVLYQQQGGTVSGGFAESHTFGKFEFRPLNWVQEEKRNDVLYIGNPSDFPNSQPLFSGYYLDGKIGTKVVKNK